MSLQTLTVLRRARKLIADPRRWIKGAFLSHRVPGVVCYCGLGALATAANIKILSSTKLSEEKKLPEEYYDAHRKLNMGASRVKSDGNYPTFFAEFNDDPRVTHPDVLEAFDNAIVLAKEEKANKAAKVRRTPKAS